MKAIRPLSSDPRDNQRSRVYAWERASARTLFRILDGDRAIRRLDVPEFEELAECQSYLDPIWKAERGRYGRARVPVPPIERPHRGQTSAKAHHDHRITLPRWSRSRWVILHEAAHRLVPDHEAHGPRFVGVLIGLLARHVGYDANELMAMADEMGVKYHVRSIGLVPVQTLSQKLARLLPTTEMDAAFELDVSWRQVRGAALQLVNKGKARWIRNRLVEIDTSSQGLLADGCLMKLEEDALPDDGGHTIYALMFRDGSCFFGRSQQMRTRVRAHRARSSPWVDKDFIVVVLETVWCHQFAAALRVSAWRWAASLHGIAARAEHQATGLLGLQSLFETASQQAQDLGIQLMHDFGDKARPAWDEIQRRTIERDHAAVYIPFPAAASMEAVVPNPTLLAISMERDFQTFP